MKSSKVMWLAFVLAMPALSYLFLDQISVRRAENYAYRWYAVESTQAQDPKQLVSKYEDALLSGGSDVKGLGLVQDKKFIVTLGEPYGDPSHIEIISEGPTTSRIGFLKYLSSIAVPGHKDMAVYFIFSDDTAVLDFVWLLLLMAVTFGLTIFMRARLERQRLQIIQDNTILSMQSFAHDFRGPFSKLRILLKLLKDRRMTQSELERYEKDLNAAVEQTDEMLSDFLSFGKTEIKKEGVNIHELLKRLEQQDFRARAKELNIRFSLKGDANVSAHSNPQKTMRVLVNLIDNAFKHAKTHVEVRVTRGEELVEISVTNDGQPIAEKDRPHLFEPFYSSRKGGVGLGLFIAHNFAREQGGDVTCKSQSGETIFRFVLPKSNDALETKEARPEKPSPSAQTLVAYVDDESFYRDLVANTLGRDAIEVDCFKSTDELLTKLKEGSYRPHLILVDRFGPNFDAVENRFAESCRDYGYLGPIVLYSSSVSSENYPDIFRAIEKSTLLSGEEINKLIREFESES